MVERIITDQDNETPRELVTYVAHDGVKTTERVSAYMKRLIEEDQNSPFTMRELGQIVDMATARKEKWLTDKSIKARPSVRAMAATDCDYIIRKATAMIEMMMEADAKHAASVVEDRTLFPTQSVVIEFKGKE